VGFEVVIGGHCFQFAALQGARVRLCFSLILGCRAWCVKRESLRRSVRIALKNQAFQRR
jgi:hypothetical protein